MNLHEFTTYLRSRTLSQSDIYDLISYIENIPYHQSKTLQNIELNKSKLDEVIKKLDASTPVAYITNRREFYGNEFYVDERVLIPRYETELLVDAAVKIIKDSKCISVLDCFTGSGAILLSILNEFDGVTGVGVDISSDALLVAEKNAEILQLQSRSNFFISDLGVEDNLTQLFDKYSLILGNPPYISDTNYSGLDDFVKKEPKLALVAKDDGLFYYNMLFCSLSVSKKHATLMVEIGYDQSLELSAMAESLRLSYYFIKDYAGHNRVMVLHGYI